MHRLAAPLLILVLAACGGSTPTTAPASGTAPSPAASGAEGALVTPAIPGPDETQGPGPAATPVASDAPAESSGPAPAGSPDTGIGATTDLSSGALIIQPDALPTDAGVDTPCGAEGTARSTSDVGANSFSIANATQNAYTLYWLDANGRRQQWFALTPGASTTQRTYESHAWLVADAQDRCIAIFHAPADLTIQPKPEQQGANGGPLFPTAAPSQQTGSATDETAARATMLAQADMPAGAFGSGVQLVGEDLAGFAANRGLRTLTQKWQTDGDLYAVFDDRWQFPTAAAAAAFLQAERRALAFEAQGLRRLDGIEAAGPNGVVYGAQLQMTGGTIQSFYDFLFQDGPFVGRIFASGAEDLDPARVVDIAKSAAGRVAQVAGSSGDGAFPNAAEAELLGHVPGAIRTACERDPNTPDFAAGSVVCRVAGGGVQLAKYIQARDTDTVTRLYASRRTDLGAASTGESCREGPSAMPWSINGTKYGDVFCYVVDGAAWIEWTDERLDIYTLAYQATPDWPALYDWWANEAGPE